MQIKRNFYLQQLQIPVEWHHHRFRGRGDEIHLYPLSLAEYCEGTGQNPRDAWKEQLEVDFVVNEGSQRYYIQSALALPDEKKRQQEMASLLRINDSFKKIIIVKDDIKPWRDENGILTMGLIDFLMIPDSLGM